MKWLAVIAVMALVLVAPSQADTSGNQRADRVGSEIATLKRQVAALQKQVQRLNKDVAFARNEAVVNYVGDACLTAVASDGLVGTWKAIDEYAQRTSGTTVFGVRAPVNDNAACTDLRPSILRELSTKPTTGAFQALLNWLKPPRR
jgi:outer membrane murein-binding lipoprotein Lpp